MKTTALFLLVVVLLVLASVHITQITIHFQTLISNLKRFSPLELKYPRPTRRVVTANKVPRITTDTQAVVTRSPVTCTVPAADQKPTPKKTLAQTTTPSPITPTIPVQRVMTRAVMVPATQTATMDPAVARAVMVPAPIRATPRAATVPTPTKTTTRTAMAPAVARAVMVLANPVVARAGTVLAPRVMT